MVTITITGPGGCISNELVVIQEALTKYGYQVTVQDSHPPEYSSYGGWGNQAQSHLDFVRKHNTERPTPVTIIMHHQPWGG